QPELGGRADRTRRHAGAERLQWGDDERGEHAQRMTAAGEAAKRRAAAGENEPVAQRIGAERRAAAESDADRDRDDDEEADRNPLRPRRRRRQRRQLFLERLRGLDLRTELALDAGKVARADDDEDALDRMMRNLVAERGRHEAVAL